MKYDDLVSTQAQLIAKERNQAAEIERLDQQDRDHLAHLSQETQGVIAANAEKVSVLKAQMGQIRATIEGSSCCLF
jgi:hypothetical protein